MLETFFSGNQRHKNVRFMGKYKIYLNNCSEKEKRKK